jgi:chromosome segregation protein
LHQGRHEAELRLRAAEANLARLPIVIGEVEGQVQNLNAGPPGLALPQSLRSHPQAEALALLLRWTPPKP